MKEYETTFVIDSLIKNEEVENLILKVEKFITNNGGEVLNTDRWGKKRLAYEIRKRQYGYYVKIEFKAPPHLNKNLEREYKLDENILRYLIVVLDRQEEKPHETHKPEAESPKAEKRNLAKAEHATKKADDENSETDTNVETIPSEDSAQAVEVEDAAVEKNE
ncbi:30S ribosomal protein S6 [candidate division KSB1 bacterium]|nr:30S ribosomal protein S6 [candidate division KSB1 bacterium]